MSERTCPTPFFSATGVWDYRFSHFSVSADIERRVPSPNSEDAARTSTCAIPGFGPFPGSVSDTRDRNPCNENAGTDRPS
ncbi:hypothetical protein DENIS_4879 [Desulfonema ishimotonii]|uniref:Uncharacterized protein n=1 Tax=Desulfonema ishimotonii TaxID=45657 RepID=A0A401G3S1_9BACT|nr:hypothetical protein DENIS_4879 [Desulfonema ishimotonii]